MNKHALVFRIAKEDMDFADAKMLFLQYASSLNFDLCFQGFDAELQHMSVQYNQPNGAILLVNLGKEPVACVAIRKLEYEIAELKRMYVKPSCRGRGIGHLLLQKIIDIARDLQYRRIRLDTLSHMEVACHLYAQYGFYKIPAYCFNPIDNALYMEKQL